MFLRIFHQLRMKREINLQAYRFMDSRRRFSIFKVLSNARDKCYHAISRDSARPHEILKLRIKDIVFKLHLIKSICKILVNGKTGTRHIPLINSIPYIKDWISQHPQGGNPNAYLLCGLAEALGRTIHVRSLHKNI